MFAQWMIITRIYSVDGYCIIPVLKESRPAFRVGVRCCPRLHKHKNKKSHKTMNVLCEYRTAIDRILRCMTFLSKMDISNSIDTIMFLRYIDLLSRVCHYSKIVIDANDREVAKNLDDYRMLQGVNNALEPVIMKLRMMKEDIASNNFPATNAVLAIHKDLGYDFLIEEIRSNLKDSDVFAGEENERLLDESIVMVNCRLREYTELGRKFFSVIGQMLSTLIELQESLVLVDGEYADIVERSYYDYFEDNEDDVEESLYNQLYDKEIINDLSCIPTSRDWAVLLKAKLGEMDFGHKTKIIREVFSHRHPLNIKDARTIKYIYENCTIEEDMYLFFRNFAEIAILQSKAKAGIPIIRRPEVAKKVMPLPSMVNQAISADAELNTLFREAIEKLIPKTGKKNMKWKWSHAKRVMEDDGIIEVVSPTEFGRQMNEVDTSIEAENCRKNVDNNEIKLPEAYKNMKYYEWPDTAKHKPTCTAIAAVFKTLVLKMNKRTSKQE